MEIQFYILSLMKRDRQYIVTKNIKKFPQIKIKKSVNGYNKNETLERFNRTKLIYRHLGFKTFGTLANFITKYEILKYQIDNKIDMMCFIEDDLQLDDTFISYVTKKSFLFNDDSLNLNMIRLDQWGEGYITSLQAAKRIKNHIDNDGICDNIDNQLRLMCGKEIYAKGTPWKLVCKTNAGDCLKTKKLPEGFPDGI